MVFEESLDVLVKSLLKNLVEIQLHHVIELGHFKLLTF